MRIRQYFSGNKFVSELLSEFKVSQGPLFHYTNQIASVGIKGGEIWMTRADCFLDPKEIEHGLEVFSKAAQNSLSDLEIASFFKILEALKERLRTCFVLSLSQNPDNNYLQSNYAGENGAVIEFQENFSHVLYTGWHTIPNSDDSFRNHFIVDTYDRFEGFVLYDDEQQLRLAKMACLAYRDLISTDAHIVEAIHFVNILMNCLVLFKSREFEVEKEYRIALVRKSEEKESFEKSRENDKCCYLYIEVRIPNPDEEKIHIRDV